MKVLMTGDTLGGVWSYAMELAAALRPHGARVALAAMGGPVAPHQRQDLARLDNVELYLSQYKVEWMADPWQDVDQSGQWLLDLEGRTQPGVVHLNGYAHTALPFRAPKLVVGHSCVLSWWQAVKGEPAPPEWAVYARRVRLGLQAASLVLAPTRAMLESLERYYGPLPHHRVVFSGCDPTRFRPGAKRPLILSAGRVWDEARNIAALDLVAPRLTWPVYVAGDDRHPDGGRPLRHVRCLGPLGASELAQWMARASIYVLPARYEPFGLSALEAALSGCALVLGDIPSLREVWGDAALFADPRDPHALQWRVQTLIADERTRLDLAARAYQRALQYTPQRMAREYLGAYQQLAHAQAIGSAGVGADAAHISSGTAQAP